MASLEAQTEPQQPIRCNPSSSSSSSTVTSQYQQLLELEESQALVHNTEPCECHLCHEMTSAGMGLVLVNCLHTFCTVCLKTFLLGAESIRCPYPEGRSECDGVLDERELGGLLSPEEYGELLERQFAALPEGFIQEEVAANTGSPTVEPEETNLLVTLTDASIVPNPEPFECPICYAPYDAYDGVILRDCFHTFCRACLRNSIKFAEDVIVLCPYKDNTNSCETIIQDREIKCLLSEEDYNAYLGRSLKKAESLAKNAFHCKKPDCTGWCVVEDNVSLFHCPVCYAENCVKCEALHAEMSCEEYKDRLSGNYEIRISERKIESMVASGEVMHCPICNAVLQKISGCDHITCTLCKSAVNWAPRR